MRSVLLAISFTSMFLLPSSSSSPTHWSSDPLLDHSGFNSLKAAADVEKLGRGHGGTAGSGGSGGIPDNSGGGGNVPAGGAVVPVIIAGAANNNHHQNTRRGASTRNIINIYWRGIITFVTTVTLVSLRQLYMFT